MSPADYELINEEIESELFGNRTKSAAMLAWFLRVGWRREPGDVEDAITDGPGDKGIDAIVVDEDLGEVTVFQAKHRTSLRPTQGDQDMRNLVGAAVYFRSAEGIDALLASGPNLEVRKLIERTKVKELLRDGGLISRLVFVTNAELDAAGRDYAESVADHDPPMEVWDRPALAAIARRTKSPGLRPETVALDVVGQASTVRLTDDSTIAVGVIPASQLVGLPGIEDMSLFGLNVRLSVGRTRINRELAATISNPGEHPLFAAYHNGLTLLTNRITAQRNGAKLKLDGVAVVNGCQSLVALNNSKKALTESLRVLVKVVEVPPHSHLADQVTYRANNQNPVDIRDQRATDPVQRGLAAEVMETFGAEFGLAVREGQKVEATRVLTNKNAAQLVMAVYLEEPWNAVRKVRLFDHDYRRIFNRSIDAHKLYFLDGLGAVVSDARTRLRPELQASFSSIRLTLAYLLARVLRESEEGRALLDRPQDLLPIRSDEVWEALGALLADIVESVNFYLNEMEEQESAFDPKVVFKGMGGVKRLAQEVLLYSRRQARRDSEYFFSLTP